MIQAQKQREFATEPSEQAIQSADHLDPAVDGRLSSRILHLEEEQYLAEL